jgi:hypothetical protein
MESRVLGVLSQCPELAPSTSPTIALEMTETEERSLQECLGQCPALTHSNHWLIAHVDGTSPVWVMNE